MACAAAIPLLCSLALAACAKTSTPAPASPAATAKSTPTPTPGVSATAVDTRLVVQQGLSIGLASNVIQSQVAVLEDAFFPPASCTSLSTGSGSSQVVQRSTTGSVTTAIVDVYYDANCTQPYIVATAAVTAAGVASTITNDESATYERPTGSTLGVLKLTETAVITMASGQTSNIAVDGTGTFAPDDGGPAVSLGPECSIPGGSDQPPPFSCGGAIVQAFPALERSLASTTSLTITLTLVPGTTDSANVAFVSTQSTTETGAIGALSIVTPAANTFALAGEATTIGSDTISGQAARFALFAPTPTGWTVVNTSDGTTFSINIVSGAEPGLSGSVTTASGKSLARLTLDQSGTGTITYGGGGSNPVTNWTLGG